MKIDLHVHSKFSDQDSEWILRKIGCSESYSEPRHIYRIAIQRGMSRVTIADHNSILGCLEIAHLPGTFISEEVTTYFPDHLGEIHVLALNINEEKHRRIQKLRRNIFELAGYLNDEGIPHVLAHPLYGLGGSLPYDVFERLLLLFRNFEVNGTRAEEQNQTVKTILSSLRPEDIERLAERHGIRARGPEPWLKNLTGGSDDHSLLYVACRYTEVPDAQGLEGFFQGLENGAARVGGGASSPEDLAHSVYSIAYQFYRDRLGRRQIGRRSLFLRFLDRSLLLGIKEKKSFLSRFARFWPRRRTVSLKDFAFHAAWGLLFQREVLKVLQEDPQLMGILKSGVGGPGDCRDQWFEFAKGVSNKVLVQFGGRVLQYADALTCGFLPLLTSIGSAEALGLLAAPYIGAFAHFAGNRQSSRQVLAKLFPSLPGGGGEKRGSSVGCFYDTLEGGFGPLFMVREQLRGRSGADLRLTEITCHDQGTVTGQEVKIFKPIGRFGFSVDPSSHFHVLPFLDVLKYCYDGNFTRIHSFTPGPMGLTALAISHILKLPIRATIHTGLLHFARRFAGDPSEEARLWKYISWYYSRMDQINVPSHWAARELARMGVPQEKMRVFWCPVDLERFTPAKRNGYLENRFALTSGVHLLYAGRISKEADIFLLGEVFARLTRTVRDVHLICVGEGPERPELEKSLEGASVFFPGPLKGEDLALLFASCDLFVSPSTSDLSGSIVMEAQASGLPAVVTDSGCLQEHVAPGETGMVVKAKDAGSLFRAVETLTLDISRRQEMGRAARRYMEERNARRIFLRTFFET